MNTSFGVSHYWNYGEGYAERQRAEVCWGWTSRDYKAGFVAERHRGRGGGCYLLGLPQNCHGSLGPILAPTALRRKEESLGGVRPPTEQVWLEAGLSQTSPGETALEPLERASPEPSNIPEVEPATTGRAKRSLHMVPAFSGSKLKNGDGQGRGGSGRLSRLQRSWHIGRHCAAVLPGLTQDSSSVYCRPIPQSVSLPCDPSLNLKSWWEGKVQQTHACLSSPVAMAFWLLLLAAFKSVSRGFSLDPHPRFPSWYYLCLYFFSLVIPRETILLTFQRSSF